VRKGALAVPVRLLPHVQQRALDVTDRLLFRYAGVRDAIEMARKQSFLVFGRKLPVVRDAHVMLVRHEIEHVLLEIRTRAADRMHLVLTDHLGKREPELCCAHCAGQRHEHDAAAVQVTDVSVGGIGQRGRVEVAVVMMNEVAHRRHLSVSFTCRWSPPPRTQRK
jgi:hypothetical protein